MAIFNESFYASCLSTFHLLYIVTLGIVAKNNKLVDKNFEKSLSKLITNILLPAFIFCEIVQNFHISYYHLIFQSLLGCMTLYMTGLLTGFISAKILGLNKNRTNFILGVFSSPHTTSIPLILIEVIHPLLAKISNIGDTDGIMDPRSRGMLYIVLNSIFSNLWRWTVPFNLINEEKSQEKIEEELKEPFITQNKSPSEKESLSISKMLKEVINMPVLASIISLALCISPDVQSYFNTPDAFFTETIISVNLIVGKSYSFLVMFVLGLNFADLVKGKDETHLETESKNIFTRYDLTVLTVMKLIVMPIIAFPIILSFFIIGVINDDVMVFLFFFMSAAPSAINVMVMCSVKNAYKDSAAMLMIIMYISSIFTLTLQNSFFLYVLSIF